MTTYICKCGRRVKKSTDASTTGNRLSGYAPGHECWGCPYAMPYGNFQWDESAKTVALETRGYECRMSKTLTYASEFSGSIKDKCTCRVHSLDFDFLSQVSAWIKDTYPDREIFGSFSKDIRASDYGSDGRYCLTITCAQNLKGVAAKRELLGQFFTPNGIRKDMTPQQEMEKILADIKKAKEVFACAPAQNADAAVTTAENAVPTATAATPTTSESGADASASTPATSLQNCESVPAASAGGSSVPMPSAPGFDFSALGDLSDQAVETDQQFDLHYGTAQDEYLISCIYVAKMHALTAKAGRYGGGTWTKWYESKGMSKSSVWNMLQTGEGFKGSTVEQLTSIPELSRKDLNLIARSGCAERLTAAAGDSQRVQELLAQVKAEKERADAAEKSAQNARKENAYFKELVKSAEAQTHKDAEKREEAESRYESALADIRGLKEQNAELQQSYHDADEGRIAARLQCQKAEGERDKAEARAKNAEGQLSGSRQVAEAAKLRADKLQEENAALKKQPIAAVVDEEEVERRANQRAHDIAEDLAAEMTADLQARLEQAASGSEQDARDAYDSIILAGRSITSIVQSAKMQFRKLPNDQRETAINQFVHTLASAQGEVSACL
nr:MAG TPA: protein of unknown function (UPF0137) [Caudoviricetes sp.]